MAKKSKAAKTLKAPAPAPRGESITALGWRLIGAGGLGVLLGFFVLSKADAMGRNWAADAAPLLILGGYALIGLGLFAPAPETGGENLPSSPPPASPSGR